MSKLYTTNVHFDKCIVYQRLRILKQIIGVFNVSFFK